MNWLRPTEICFTQDSVAGSFSDGRSLADVFEQLLYKRLTPDDLGAIEVVKENGLWMALTGNRRLFLYRKLEKLGVISTIPVWVRKLDDGNVRDRLGHRQTTKSYGQSVRCRQWGTDTQIDEIIARWQSSWSWKFIFFLLILLFFVILLVWANVNTRSF